MVRLLLDFGANVNHRSQRLGGHTAIEAVQAMNDSGQQSSRYYDGFSGDFGGIIEMLLEARAHDERVPGGYLEVMLKKTKLASQYLHLQCSSLLL